MRDTRKARIYDIFSKVIYAAVGEGVSPRRWDQEPDTLDLLIRTNCRKGIEGLRQKGWTLIITGSSMEAAVEDGPSIV